MPDKEAGPGWKRYVEGGRMTKVRREVLRRMQCLADGVPFRAPRPPRPPSKKLPWTRVVVDKSGRRLLRIDCECGKPHVITMRVKQIKLRSGYFTKQIWCRTLDLSQPRTNNNCAYKGRWKKLDTISNMPKEALNTLIKEVEQHVKS